jgi:isopenicillin-N N-acyltransferase-like protein
MFPVIAVSGGSFERGRQYGAQARDRIHLSIDVYAEMYHHFAGWDWHDARIDAARFGPAIEAFAPAYLTELSGIADGAGVDLDDVMAINVRTEVLYSNRMSNALGARAPAECSVFGSAQDDRPVVVGQNWDWAPAAMGTCVVLQAEPDDAPAYTTVVEAGLLAKFGVNSEGFAVMTNALSCTEDVADPAVPYHVMLRALLECSSTAEALDRLGSAQRASSANYLLVDSEGRAVDVEARPGGAEALHRIERDDRGVLLHTNHFVSPEFDAVDYADLVVSTTRTRLARLSDMVSGAPDPGALTLFESAMTDHTNAPESLCRHPDDRLPQPEQSMTVSSVLVDLTAGEIAVSEGPPCERGYEPLPWPARSPVRPHL